MPSRALRLEVIAGSSLAQLFAASIDEEEFLIGGTLFERLINVVQREQVFLCLGPGVLGAKIGELARRAVLVCHGLLDAMPGEAEKDGIAVACTWPAGS